MARRGVDQVGAGEGDGEPPYRAADYYGKFVELWKKADPMLLATLSFNPRRAY